MKGPSSTRRVRTAIASACAVAVLSGGLLACGTSSSFRDAAPPSDAAAVAVEPRPTSAPVTTDAGGTPVSSYAEKLTTEVYPSQVVDAPTATTLPATPPPVDVADPAVAGRPLPPPVEAAPPSAVSPWATFTTTAPNGKVATDVGCAGTSAPALDAFFAERVGPVMGWDYQHVYPLGGDRYLWLFQDAFLDRKGTAPGLGSAGFVHNAALVQTGSCFSLQHGGTTEAPLPFEAGDGNGSERATWFWPLGGEVSGDRLWVFWAKMLKDGYDPEPPDGLGWHPVGTYLASYDPTTLTRLSFAPAPNTGVSPLYGYAVASEGAYSYLFGNTFEQNLVREGGYGNAPHSATRTWLARVPRGQLWLAPEYRTADGWSPDPSAAVPIQRRFAVEDPVQPRFIAGRWVAVSKVDGYWGEDMVVDTALDPWGPWTTAERVRLVPRGGDMARNTYHAHLMPWLDRSGNLVVSVSGNARNMLRDAWPFPERYRPMVFTRTMPPIPPPPTVPATVLPADPADTTTTMSDVASQPPTVTSDPASSTSVVVTTSTASTAPTTSTSTTTSTTTTASTATTTLAPAPSSSTSSPSTAVGSTAPADTTRPGDPPSSFVP